MQAVAGPIARERAPRERNIPITFPFSSPSPAHSHTKRVIVHSRLVQIIVATNNPDIIGNWVPYSRV